MAVHTRLSTETIVNIVFGPIMILLSVLAVWATVRYGSRRRGSQTSLQSHPLAYDIADMIVAWTGQRDYGSSAAVQLLFVQNLQRDVELGNGRRIESLDRETASEYELDRLTQGGLSAI
jgi:hypothetical protein